MRLLTVLFTITLYSTFVLAQAPGVELSETITFKNNEEVGEEILLAKGLPHIYTYERPSKGLAMGKNKLMATQGINIVKYDEDLNFVKAMSYDRYTDKRQHFNMTSLGDNFIWTYATEPPPSKSKKGGKAPRKMYNLKADIIDANGKKIKSHRVGKVAVREFAESVNQEARSPNGEYLLIVISNERGGRGLLKSDETAYANIAVINKAGELVTNEKHRFRGKRDQIVLESIAIDNEGGAYLIARKYGSQKINARNRDKGKGGSVPYTLKNIYLPKGAEKALTSTVSSRGAFLRGVSHFHSRKGSIGLVGLYADDFNGRIQGVVTATNADTSARLTKQKFSLEDYENMGKGAADKKLFGSEIKGLSYAYYFQGGANTTNGPSILLEGFMQRVTQGQNGGETITNYYYDGLVIDLNDDGELMRANNVPKYQRVVIQQALGGGFSIGTSGNKEKYYASTSAISLGDRLGVLYNDNPKNLVRDEEKRAKGTRWGNAAAILAYFDEDGKLIRRPLFDRKADKLLLHVKSGMSTTSGEVYVLGSRVRSLAANELNLARLSPGTGGSLDALPTFD